MNNPDPPKRPISEKHEPSEENLTKSRIENENLNEYSKIPNNELMLRNENSELKEKLKEIFEKYKQSEENLTTLHIENEKLTNQIDEYSKIPNNEFMLLNENSELKEKLKEISKKYEENLLIFYIGIKHTYNENSKLREELKEISEKHKQSEENLTTSHIENEKFKKLTLDFIGKNARNKILVKENEGIISSQSQKDFEIQELQQKHEKEIEDLKNLLNKREKENQDLAEKNAELKTEASQYRSALGRVKNFRMNDDSVQLKSDILALQKMLKNYVTTLKGNFEINFNEIEKLMKKHKITTKITPQEPNKPLIKAVLQFHILNKIIEYAEEFFEINKNSGSLLHLEAVIASKSKELEVKLVEFSNSRNEIDAITQTASTKIRQVVNAALGNRGFSDILEENNVSQEHIFIKHYKDVLNEEMNKYRIIKNPMRKESIENIAPKLIREFIRIIWFRLKIQEPDAQMKWVPMNSEIDPNIMEGNWDDGDIDDLVVEICAFPIIGRDLDKKEKRKIYTRAQVFTKKK